MLIQATSQPTRLSLHRYADPDDGQSPYGSALLAEFASALPDLDRLVWFFAAYPDFKRWTLPQLAVVIDDLRTAGYTPRQGLDLPWDEFADAATLGRHLIGRLLDVGLTNAYQPGELLRAVETYARLARAERSPHADHHHPAPAA